MITQVGLCNAEGVAPGLCHDAQPILVFIGNAQQPPTDVPGIFVSLPNSSVTYPCSQVAIHQLGYPFGWSCVLPSFTPRYVGSFNLTVNSSAGLSAPFTQVSYVPDLRIQRVTGCSTAETGRVLPGCVDGEWLNITGQGFVQPLQVDFGAISSNLWGVSCRQVTVLSQERARCKVDDAYPIFPKRGPLAQRQRLAVAAGVHCAFLRTGRGSGRCVRPRGGHSGRRRRLRQQTVTAAV